MHESGDVLFDKFPKLPLDAVKAVVDNAHANNVPVVAHAMSFDDTIEALECGVDGMTHTFVDQAKSVDKLLELYARNRAHCNPTLACMGSLTTEGAALQARFAQDPLAQRMLMSSSSRENLCKCMAMGKQGTAAVENAYNSVRALYRAGVPIIVGSDAAGPALGTAYGLSLHMEMHLLIHEVGMPPVDVLKGATSLTANRFGFADRGKLESGRLADLVLVEGDILKVLADRTHLCMPLKGVWREGIAAREWDGALARGAVV